MKKTLAAILTGISLAFGNMAKSDDLPTEIELRDGKYYTTDQVNLEVKDMALRKIIDKSQTQQVYLRGDYTPEGTFTIAYSTHPFEEKATRPKQGFASTSKIFVGLPEGVKIELLSEQEETIGNFDKVTERNLKPLDQTTYAKTFLKMGNNGIEKLRGYDPIQKLTESLNGSIFLLTGTDLNLEDKISIYGGLKAFSESITKKEQERGKSTFKGELELQEIPLYPHDGIIQPTETKREIKWRIKPSEYSGEKIPFTVYHKLVLGTEQTKGVGKLEAFFSGEIDNPNSEPETKQAGIIEALSKLQGYWKFSKSPGEIADYVEVTQTDPRTIKFKIFMGDTNEKTPQEEGTVSLTYYPEKNILDLTRIDKRNEIREKKRIYDIRRLSEKERKEL